MFDCFTCRGQVTRPRKFALGMNKALGKLGNIFFVCVGVVYSGECDIVMFVMSL
jgi:hypothetical protein